MRSALVCAPVVLLLFASSASARGGSGGGGTTSPSPAPSTTPCAQLSFPKQNDSVNLAGKTTTSFALEYKLTNCSGDSETLTVTFTDEPVGVDPACAIPPFTSAPVTLRAGDTKGFSITTPEQPCPVFQHTFEDVVTDSFGNVLATGTQWMISTTRL